MNDFDTPGRHHEDDDIRRLLDEAVSDVEPRGDALASIHARTKVTPMQRKRSWILGAGAAAVATAATVAAVTVLSSDSTSQRPNNAGPAASTSTSPSGSPSTSPTPSNEPSESASPATTHTVPVYYVGDTSRGPRLYREFHRVTAADPLEAAVEEALSAAPHDPDYRTAWPAVTVAATSFDGDGNDGQITIELRNEGVDLRERPAGMSADEAQMAVDQLIYTAQAATQTRAPVQFLLARQGSGDSHTDTVLGVPASEPLAQGDPADVLAQVWIIEPAEGAKVTAPFEVSGLAAAFEANVQWELKQGDKVVKRGFTMAEECCTMAPYSFKVDAAPGDYTLVVHDSDPSGGEGFAPWQDTKEITVVP